MSDLYRIDPAAVPGVFARVGAVPIQGEWQGVMADVRHSCCLLSALYLDRPGATRAHVARIAEEYLSPAVAFAARLGLSLTYATGLATGWDDTGLCCDEESDYSRGYRDGAAAWAACQEGVVS